MQTKKGFIWVKATTKGMVWKVEVLDEKEYGFKQAMVDHTLNNKRNGDDIIMLIIYVDHMVVASSNSRKIVKLQSYLGKEFEMKELGALKYFLRIESKQGLFFS